MILQKFKLLLPVIVIIFLFSCQSEKSDQTILDDAPYFEGVITLSESRGLYGAISKIHKHTPLLKT